MLNKDTLQVLKELNSITNTAILKYPRSTLISEENDIMVDVDLGAFDSEAFENIHLIDKMGDFISFMRLFENPEVQMDEKEINIKEGSKRSSFLFDNPALMSAFDKDSVQFDRTEEVPDVCVFELTVDDFKDINKASGVFKTLEEVIIRAQDGDAELVLGNTSSFNARSNSYSLEKPGTATKEFEVKIPVTNFKKLPVSNYTVHVKYNSERDAYRVLLKNNDIDLRVILSVKV